MNAVTLVNCEQDTTNSRYIFLTMIAKVRIL